MTLDELKDIDFVDADPEKVQAALFESYKNITGRTLAKGDPIRLFILAIANVIVIQLNKLNYTGKQNLLKYSSGDILDQVAALVDTDRLPAAAATTTIAVTLSAARATETIIPSGTRVSPGNGVYFATDTDLAIQAGDTTGSVSATCTETGDVGNGFLPGEISQIVDREPYVQTMSNTTTSEGGSDIESDDSFRERAHEAPERFSTAGPDGAYKYHVKSVSSLISDVCVYSPTPGVVEIRPLLTGGIIPGTELLDAVSEHLSDKQIRPLTDNVQVLAPEAVTYDIELSYYVKAGADLTSVQSGVAQAVDDFVDWQKAVIGRDINPSKLVSMVMDVPGVKRVVITYPVYTAVSKVQLAVADDITITMAGSEDE